MAIAFLEVGYFSICQLAHVSEFLENVVWKW